MLKTPVSILQELTVQRKIAAPDYQVSGTGQPHCMSFTCRVKTGTESAQGFGSTKKDAKHDAARNMLKHFGITLDQESQSMAAVLLPLRPNRLDGPVINYVGKLNEFCSGNKHPHPTYVEDITTVNAQFCVTCTFYNFKTEGYGFNKKDAKQDSAKKMLAIIKESDLGNGLAEIRAITPINNKLEENSEITDQVLKKYTELVKNINISDGKCENNNTEFVNGEEMNISTWEELTEFFDKCGYSYKVTSFQEKPLILCLKINEHVIMQYGNSEEEIYCKFVKNVVDMIRHGVDFSKPLLDL